MEFKVYQKELELQSRGWVPTFHDVTKEVNEIVAASGVKNGTCTERVCKFWKNDSIKARPFIVGGQPRMIPVATRFW